MGYCWQCSRNIHDWQTELCQHGIMWWNFPLCLQLRSKTAAGIRPTSYFRPRSRTSCPSWTCTTCGHRNRALATTWRWDRCVSCSGPGGARRGRSPNTRRSPRWARRAMRWKERMPLLFPQQHKQKVPLQSVTAQTHTNTHTQWEGWGLFVQLNGRKKSETSLCDETWRPCLNLKTMLRHILDKVVDEVLHTDTEQNPTLHPAIYTCLCVVYKEKVWSLHRTSSWTIQFISACGCLSHTHTHTHTGPLSPGESVRLWTKSLRCSEAFFFTSSDLQTNNCCLVLFMRGRSGGRRDVGMLPRLASRSPTSPPPPGWVNTPGAPTASTLTTDFFLEIKRREGCTM